MTSLAPVIDNKLPDIRLNLHAIRQQRHLLTKTPIFEKLCSRIPSPVLILNHTRQVVWANQLAVKLVGLTNDSLLHGSRLEDFILDPHLVSNTDQEPFTVEKESFHLVILEDTSLHTQRLILERTFFHDLLNTAGGMQGLTGILQDATEDELPDLKDSVKNLADQLVEEILSQRDLLAAEMGDLKTHTRPLDSFAVMDLVIKTYQSHSSTGDREISMPPHVERFHFYSDPVLLNRVLGNMVKNALEASKAPAVVIVDCGQKPGEVWFSVHNPGFIPQEAQDGVFKQSFSTKGAGRGTGTFSMQLFAQKYLGGRIEFDTDATTGTTFTVTLPTGGP